MQRDLKPGNCRVFRKIHNEEKWYHDFFMTPFTGFHGSLISHYLDILPNQYGIKSFSRYHSFLRFHICARHVGLFKTYPCLWETCKGKTQGNIQFGTKFWKIPNIRNNTEN